MSTEILLVLWFIILVINAALLWAWYRISAGRQAAPPRGDRETPTVLLEPDDSALAQHPLHSSHFDMGHVSMILEIPEGTHLRITVETLNVGVEAPATQVLDVMGENPPDSALPLAQPYVPDNVRESLSLSVSAELGGQAKGTVETAAGAIFQPLPDARARWVLGLGSLILVGFGLLGWMSVPQKMGLLPTLLVVLGLLLLGLSVVSWRKGLPVGLTRFLAGIAGWLGVSPAQVVCLALGLLFAISAGVAAGTGNLMVNPTIAVVGWLFGVVYIIIGGWQSSSLGYRLTWKALAVAGVLFLVALLLRIYDTAHIPVVLTGDEGNAAFSAIEFIKGNTDNIFRVGWHAFPSLFFYLQSLFIFAMGHTIEALRIPSATAGALSVVAVYLLGRSMFGNRAGLLAAIFLVGFHYHLHFSRIGLNNVWDGLWYTITLGLLWHAWANERRSSYLLAGVTLGIAQYFYTSARMLFPLIIIWLALVGWLDQPRLRRSLPHLLLMGLATLAVLFPIALYLSHNTHEIFGPMREVSVLGPWLEREVAATGQPAWLILLRQVGLGFKAFAFTNLKYWYHPGTALLRPVSAAIFLLGLLFLALRARDARGLLIATWLIAVALTGGLSESTPAAQRYPAAAPACALVIGFSLDRVAAWLAGFWSGKARWVSLAVFLLAVGIAADDARFYFFEYTPNSYYMGKYDFAGYGSAVAQRLAGYLQGKPDDSRVYFFGGNRMGYYSISSLPYLAPHVTGVDMPQSWGSQGNPQPSGDHLFFVFLPEGADSLPGVETAYPGGQLIVENAGDGSPLYSLYECSTAGD